jgi:hypothetical protein
VLVVTPARVILPARLGVGNVEISPIAHMPQTNAVVVEARTGVFVAFANIPLGADIYEGPFLLVVALLSPVVALGLGAGRLLLRLRGSGLGPCSHKGIPVAL